jgi:hypothetical protein
MPRKTDAKRRPRGKYRFTRKDCQRGYQAALAKCSEDWELAAWFHYRIRGWYRKQKGAIA